MTGVHSEPASSIETADTRAVNDTMPITTSSTHVSVSTFACDNIETKTGEILLCTHEEVIIVSRIRDNAVVKRIHRSPIAFPMMIAMRRSSVVLRMLSEYTLCTLRTPNPAADCGATR